MRVSNKNSSKNKKEEEEEGRRGEPMVTTCSLCSGIRAKYVIQPVICGVCSKPFHLTVRHLSAFSH